MREIVLATGNRHKVEEVREILADTGVGVRALSEFPGVQPAVEDGTTFEENAIKKAESAAAQTARAAMADDSGLTVDALDGAPGVYSARYAGRDGDHAANNAKLLDDMKDVPASERSARFVCVIAVAAPGRKTQTFRGTVEGRILTELTGEAGFGYDPLFYSDELGSAFAQASSRGKNAVSHRGRALAAFSRSLEKGQFAEWF
jgi:XTP/dITP diphosphohydrolase